MSFSSILDDVARMYSYFNSLKQKNNFTETDIGELLLNIDETCKDLERIEVNIIRSMVNNINNMSPDIIMKLFILNGFEIAYTKNYFYSIYAYNQDMMYSGISKESMAHAVYDLLHSYWKLNDFKLNNEIGSLAKKW